MHSFIPRVDRSPRCTAGRTSRSVQWRKFPADTAASTGGPAIVVGMKIQTWIACVSIWSVTIEKRKTIRRPTTRNASLRHRICFVVGKLRLGQHPSQCVDRVDQRAARNRDALHGCKVAMPAGLWTEVKDVCVPPTTVSESCRTYAYT